MEVCDWMGWSFNSPVARSTPIKNNFVGRLKNSKNTL